MFLSCIVLSFCCVITVLIFIGSNYGWICCVTGSMKGRRGVDCQSLVSSTCGSVAKQCCLCCQEGIKNADHAGLCKTEVGSDECKIRRHSCCLERIMERLNGLLYMSGSIVRVQNELLCRKYYDTTTTVDSS